MKKSEMQKENNTPERHALKLVVFGEKLPDHVAEEYPFPKGSTLLMLGEIANMPGHCAVVTLDDGRVYVGYHLENFRELDVEET
jgi:hypothetical protein